MTLQSSKKWFQTVAYTYIIEFSHTIVVSLGFPLPEPYLSDIFGPAGLKISPGPKMIEIFVPGGPKTIERTKII